ncbi:LysR family transcriptional regulator [Streptomyces phaeochromogenes]|uniref:LysR family transcriptional regulator n=1 Tax=Streptomyces phaeochromogenes TaxID=1923 RepID=UPI0036CE5A35
MSIAHRLRQTDQLRYRTADPRPGSPLAGPEAVARRAAKMPAVLWPRWQVRLDPVPAIRKNLGSALAVALLLVDSRIDLGSAADMHLSGQADQPITTHVLQALRAAPQWEHIQIALIRLADYLDTHDVPIDYGRRRRLDYTQLLSVGLWDEVCERVMLQAGIGRRHQLAQCFLFEKISGLDGHSMPQFPTPPGPFKRALARFPFLLTPELLGELDRAAVDFLSGQGIVDEPLTWEPPITLLDGLNLPHPNPDQLDLVQLHSRVTDGQLPARMADELGTDLRTVRFILAGGNGRANHRELTGLRAARRALPRTLFEELYVRQDQPFQKIALERGLEVRDVTVLVDKYGLPRHNHCPRGAVDPDWLHAQYVDHNRSITDIAKERGVSAGVVARWIRTHGIPRSSIRRRLSRPALDLSDADSPLEPVLRTAHDLRRLQTFLGVVGHPTFKAAAQSLGRATSGITGHLQRLERDFRGQLLRRASKKQPMRLTALGQQVFQAALPLAQQLGITPGEADLSASSPRG